MQTLTKNAAVAAGFAAFNSGPHLCVDVPDDPFTITCRNSQGKKVTFAFCQQDGGGHQCVDICHHGNKKSENGAPLQDVSIRGQGPLLYAIGVNAKVPATLTVLSLKQNMESKEPIFRKS